MSHEMLRWRMCLHISTSSSVHIIEIKINGIRSRSSRTVLPTQFVDIGISADFVQTICREFFFQVEFKFMDILVIIWDTFNLKFQRSIVPKYHIHEIVHHKIVDKIIFYKQPIIKQFQSITHYRIPGLAIQEKV